MARASTIARRTDARTRRRILASLAACGVALPIASAVAQTPSAAVPARAASASAAQLETVVITASKRKEKQREQAGTVSVLGGEELENRGARDQEDTLKLTPGVQFNKGDVASNTVTIRGIGSSTANEGSGVQQQTTGIYLEDVPLTSFSGKGTIFDPLAWDLDRIEVLRGPQGVLFGSGSLGGALRYLYKKPVLGAVEASLKGEYAKASKGEGTFSAYGMVNAPLGERAAIRVVAYDRRDPGYIDNLGTGHEDANDVSQRGGRVLVTVRPTADLTATLLASTQKTKQGDTFSVSPDPSRLEHTAPNDSKRTSRTDFYSLTADWTVGRHTITSITGHWRNKGTSLIDDTELFASVGLPLPEVTRPSTGGSKAVSQELRIASNPGGSFNYVAGVFWQRQDADSAAKQIDPSAAFGLTDLVDLTTSGRGTEKAVFGDAEYAFGSGWSAGLGARYYRTDTRYRQRGTIFGGPADIPAAGGGDLESSDSGLLPRATVKYRFGADNLWYGLVSKGYRYGGVNGTAPFREYKSDSLWNYETGLRLTPTEGVQLDLTAFLLDWKDAQFTYFTTTATLPESGIDNVGRARSRGLEIALRWRVNAILDVAAAAAYVDAETRSDTLIPLGNSSTTAPAGSRLPGTPRLQSALQTNVRFDAPLQSTGRFNATYTHVGDRVMFLGGNKPAASFDTFDFGLSFARENWTLGFGLANAFDKKGVLSITGAPAGAGPFAQYFLQRPRTLSASLRYDY